jgi:hypothetical protein
VLVVPRGALQSDPGSLALACALFPVRRGRGGERGGRALPGAVARRTRRPAPTASERDAAFWPALLAHAAPAPLATEEEGPTVLVHGTDVTRRLRLATRALRASGPRRRARPQRPRR